MAEEAICVIENGSGTTKVGFSGEEHMRTVFPSVVGRFRYQGMTVGKGYDKVFVGNNAQAKRGILTLRYPIENGIVNNWDDMEKLWTYSFYDELQVKPEERGVLLSETPLNPSANREETTKIMFEKFSVPKFFLISSANLSLFGNGRTTGIVLESGDGVTSAVPIFEGYSLPFAISRVELGGRNVTEHLQKLLEEKGCSLTTSAEKEIVREMKEKISYVALDYDEELKKSDSSSELIEEFQLPDGQSITVASERFKCLEVLFQPKLVGLGGDGVDQLIVSSVMKCDADIHESLFSNIVLSGGTTMCPGFVERIQKRTVGLSPEGIKINIIASPERNYSAWIGGSILSSLTSFEEMLISKVEYDETGPSIVRHKCSN